MNRDDWNWPKHKYFTFWTLNCRSVFPKTDNMLCAFFTFLKKTVILWSKRVDGKYDFTFYKNMKTEVLPSYQAAQTIKVREICIIWCPTSIENFTFYKKCVFYINQDAPRLFARNFQQFACFCRNLHVSSRWQCTESQLSSGYSMAPAPNNGQWLRPMSPRKTLECSKIWL